MIRRLGNKKILFLALVALVLTVGCAISYLLYNGSAQSYEIVDWRGKSDVHIVLTDTGFKPSRVRVTNGTNITFVTTRDSQFWPASNTHPTHSIYPEFDPTRPLNPDESWVFTPDKVGGWGFHDHIRSYFTGSIYVEE